MSKNMTEQEFRELVVRHLVAFNIALSLMTGGVLSIAICFWSSR